MEDVIDIVSWICLIGGSFFLFVGAIGVLRMPDIYTRSHAVGITDTLAAGLILIGLMFQAGLTLVTVKLVMILLFLLFIFLTFPEKSLLFLMNPYYSLQILISFFINPCKTKGKSTQTTKHSKI